MPKLGEIWSHKNGDIRLKVNAETCDGLWDIIVVWSTETRKESGTWCPGFKFKLSKHQLQVNWRLYAASG